MNLVRQGPKKLILYQQVQKHHGAVYSLDFTSKSNDLRLFGPMEHWLKMLWASRKMQPASLPYNATNLLTVFGPPFFGNVARHAYFKFMLLTFYSDPHTTDTIFKAVCISNTFCSFAGSGWPWLSLIPRFHNMALRRAVGDGTSKLPRGSMFSWVAAWTTLDVQPFSTSMWIGGNLSQASQHTGGARLEYTSLTA